MPAADLFSTLARRERLHPQFVSLRESSLHEDARAMMNELLDRMGDPNGKFVSHFQGDAFHSRLFELTCFAYLEEAGLAVNRSFERPDFVASNGACRVAIEAVTANPPTGQATDISLRNMALLSEDKILEKVSREFAGRIGNSLHKKLEQNYHKLPHCKKTPLVLMVAPFFEAGANFYTDDAMIYPLFGAPEGGWNEIFPFFRREKASTVSAVVYCNQFTVSRLLRLATDFSRDGLPKATRRGTCYRRRDDEHHVLTHFWHCLDSPDIPKETWSEGVTVFDNPFADYPLPRGFLPGTSYVFVHDGYVTREVRDFHPVVSFMHIEKGSSS
jgi:hypothetical protein